MKLSSLALTHCPYWAIDDASAQQLWATLDSISVETHNAELAEHIADLRREVMARREGTVEAFTEDEDENPDSPKRQRETARTNAAARDDRRYAVSDGIAVINLVGPLTKAQTSFSSGTSTAYTRNLIQAAAKDPEVKGIFMVVDSPGGSVAGTDDLARAVADAARKKPVWAYIQDMGASAAYWIPCQANKVLANPTALVGSLGTYTVLYDMSRAAENEGVKVMVLSTGKYKGAGVPGAAITDEQRDQMQSVVDDLNEDFINAVARGRSIAKATAREMFDGAVHKAPKALAKGLIDGISGFDQAFTDFRRECFAKADDHADVRSSFEAIAAEEEPPRKEAEPPAAEATTEEFSDQGARDELSLALLSAATTLAR